MCVCMCVYVCMYVCVRVCKVVKLSEKDGHAPLKEINDEFLDEAKYVNGEN